MRIAPVLALDLDGTIRRSKSGALFGPTDPDDVELYHDVEAKLWGHRAAGFYVLGVTNQGVVGYGTRTVAEVQTITLATRQAFEVDPFDAIESCFALPPDAGGKMAPYHLRSLRRKPGYGMLATAEAQALALGIQLDWDRSIFVGDRAEDRACAEAAGLAFAWAWDFFGRGAPSEIPAVSLDARTLLHRALDEAGGLPTAHGADCPKIQRLSGACVCWVRDGYALLGLTPPLWLAGAPR